MNKRNPVIGITIYGTSLAAAVVDGGGRILAQSRYPSPDRASPGAIVDSVVHTVNCALSDTSMDTSTIAAVGIGIPGFVDRACGCVKWSPNFAGWSDVPLQANLHEALGLPVVLANDADVCALGEYTFGAGTDAELMVMLTIGSGVDGSAIRDGRIYEGARGRTPDLGHQIILADGPACPCGSFGCLNALANRNAICERAMRKMSTGQTTLLRDMCGGDARSVTPSMIAEVASKGDTVSIGVLEETGYYVGIGIANAARMLGPDVLVIGGGIARAGDLLLKPVRRTLEVIARDVLSGCSVVPAQLSDDAGLLGAAALARSWQRKQ